MTPMDDTDDRDREPELDALLRATDPWPGSRAVDPALAANALALVEKEIEMSGPAVPAPSTRRRRRLLAVLAAGVVVVALVGGVAVVRATDEGSSTSSSPGRAVGDAFASCLRFSEETLALAPIAFDGTVTDIADDGTITFSVERWYRGGEGETATARASTLVEGAPELNGGVGFVEGRRYLVSGDRQDGVLVPAICGFTVEHDDAMAQRWASAFGA